MPESHYLTMPDLPDELLLPLLDLIDRPRRESADLVANGQIATPWGKAYRRGERMGNRETYGITGTQAP
jgi:hypothetical protein